MHLVRSYMASLLSKQTSLGEPRIAASQICRHWPACKVPAAIAEACVHAFDFSSCLLSSGYIISTMLLRSAARRHGLFAGQWMKNTPTCRNYSALQSSIKITSTPAPHSGSITILSLNRPQARNALSKQMLGELNGVIEGLHREAGKGGTRALIIASESDNAFCAGADLKERVGMSQDE